MTAKNNNCHPFLQRSGSKGPRVPTEVRVIDERALQQHERLVELSQELTNHIWSFETDSFHQYFQAFRRESEFFDRAERLGITAVSMLIGFQRNARVRSTIPQAA